MTRTYPFIDRTDAGRKLAAALRRLDLLNPVVLALPRGGVPVAVEIARELAAPIDLIMVRKIGVPHQPELAAAAVVDGDTPEIVVNEDIVAMTGVTRAYIDRQAGHELAEIERRRRLYLKDRPRVPLDGRDLVIVDDGIATGASIRAAISALKRKQARCIVLAVPVGPPDVLSILRREVDSVVCLEEPEDFHAVGSYYRDFRQLTDDEVVRGLREAAAASPLQPP